MSNGLGDIPRITLCYRVERPGAPPPHIFSGKGRGGPGRLNRIILYITIIYSLKSVTGGLNMYVTNPMLCVITVMLDGHVFPTLGSDGSSFRMLLGVY